MSVNLRSLKYSPSINPLIEPKEIATRKGRVATGVGEHLVNPATGEVAGVSVVHRIVEKDDIDFVKVFAAGVAAAFELNKTAYRVFQAVLQEYERTPMHGGFADTVELFWFNGGLSGRSIDMSEKTFQRGLKQLLEKGFLAPKSASVFWINPALFFKGDRVKFVTEYRRKKAEGKHRLME
jgi:hypothetical protein